MSESVSEAPEAPDTPAAVPDAGAAPAVPVAGVSIGLSAGSRAAQKRSDFLYYGLRNKKLMFGIILELLLVLLAIIGPIIAKYPDKAYTGFPAQRPGSRFWLGTTDVSQDVFSQV